MCHGFQITYFMIQQFFISLIIEFVETFNREVKENTYYLNNDTKFGYYYLKRFRSTTARWNMQNLTIKIISRNTNLRKEDLLHRDHK